MRTLLLIVFAKLSLAGFAQQADFPDYRSKKDNFIRVREKDIRSDLAVFAFAGIEESIGKLPLKTVPVKSFGPDFMKFEGNNIQVHVKAGVFQPAKHKLTYFEEKHLVKIDNKPYFGNYGKLPKTTVESVTVIVNKDTVAIPPVAFSDLFNPSFTYNDASGGVKSHNAVYLSSDNRNIYVYMLNREASGTYEVTWVIQDKKYLRRVVDFGLLK